MRRDLDLIREILLFIESEEGFNGSGYGKVDARRLNRSPDAVLYQMSLLADAKYVSVVNWLAHGDPLIRGLTWEGHDFLDSVRDPKIWEQTKDGAKAAGGFTFDLLKDLAKGFLKKQLEERTGVKF